MPIVKQLSIFLVNEPGVLHGVCGALSEAGIDILALMVTDTVDHAVVRFIVSDPAKAQEVLEEGNLFVVDNRVNEIPLPSRAGILAELAGELSKAKVNIEYAYGSTTGPQGTLYLRAKDPEAAEKIIAKFLAKK